MYRNIKILLEQMQGGSFKQDSVLPVSKGKGMYSPDEQILASHQ
jgi:hypothetical protein